MSRKEEYISYQTLMGKKVVDVKGALIGEVNDVAFDFKQPKIILRITTKARENVEVSTSDIQSFEDLILLKKELKLPSPPPTRPRATSTKSKKPETMVICQNCGIKLPSRAKFCPKCGGKIK